MTRDELILNCQDIVKNLVRKYNNHKLDEDLVSTGMVEVVKCVDKCLSDGIEDVSQIRARCNTWARNAILNEIYKERIKVVDDNTLIDVIEAEEPLWETIHIIDSVLTQKEQEIFDMLLNGEKMAKICGKMSITQPTFYEHYRNIKKKIQESFHNFEVD